MGTYHSPVGHMIFDRTVRFVSTCEVLCINLGTGYHGIDVGKLTIEAVRDDKCLSYLVGITRQTNLRVTSERSYSTST